MQASVSDATAYHSHQSDGSVTGFSRYDAEDFGTHSSTHQNAVTTTIGSNAAGVPFVQFSVSTPDTENTPNSYAQLNYSWKVSSNNGSSDRVLVHISTAGWLDYVYGLTPDDNFYNLPLDRPYSYPGASVTAVFSTNSYIDSPFTTLLNYDQRAYELGFGGNYGGFTWGGIGTNITSDKTNHFSIENGGEASGHGQFSQSFDIWVRPNTENSISIGGGAGRIQNHNYDNYITEYFTINGYIDPIITIDPAYSSNYTLEVSQIPFAPVPVPGAVWLFGSGLLGLLGLKRQRKI